MVRSKGTTYALIGSCLAFMCFVVRWQLVDHKKTIIERSISRTFSLDTAESVSKIESPVDPFAPNNAQVVDYTYNPFTKGGRAFWSSVVEMNITAGIFDDCNKISGGSKKKRPLPEVFYNSYDKYVNHLAKISKGMHREGTSLSYPEESLVLWNIITKVPYVKTVCETGFNTGEGTALWLIARPDVHVYSFDIGFHPYAKLMAEHIKEIFPGRHNITWGDSTKTLPEFVKNNSEVLCDIIYVDGGHTYDISKKDFENFSKIGYTGSIVILDNYPDHRSIFMKDLGGMWEDNRRDENILEVFKCNYGRKRGQGFSFGVLTKPSNN